MTSSTDEHEASGPDNGLCRREAPHDARVSSAKAATFEYELFVVHADADQPFVHGYLLPAVGLTPERVLLSSVLGLGAPRAAEIERGVQTSRLSVVVLSPAYLTDRWAEFGEQLASYASGVGGRLVPLLRAECELPLRIEFKVPLDFRDPARWAEQAQRLRAHLQQPVPTPQKLPCPYPGMRAYSVETAPYFHGREAEVDEIVGRLRMGEREIYVIGPSGSGKSSLVEAGVLPRLAEGVPGLGPFLVRSMRPGELPSMRLSEVLEAPEGTCAMPARAIDALLVHHAPDTSMLIMIDQLEELFTLASADECTKFLAALRTLRAHPRCVVVLTLRADFYGAFMESPLWEDLHGRISRINVGPLRGAALRAAIERPAHNVGVFFEPELIERLLADAASEPGTLPLMQETLVQLWERRRLRLLTLADYQALGGRDRNALAIVLSRRADATVRALPPAQKQIARRILLRLISFGEGRSDTRRQQPRSKLRVASDDVIDFNAVLRRLIADRLLTADEHDDHGDARIDLAHEVMIAAWPTLAGWIQTCRADEQRRRQLEVAAAQWVERGRGAGCLLDEIELPETEAWRLTETARELGDSADVVALVAASRAARENKANEAEASRKQIHWLAGGASVGMFLLLAVIAANAIFVARAQEQELLRDAVQTNAYAAHAYAGTAALLLREQVDVVVAIAADPAVARMLHSVDDEALEQRRSGTPFESLSLFDRFGKTLSHAASVPSDSVGKDYSWRDYFGGTRRLGEECDQTRKRGEECRRDGYISRAFRSEYDGLYKFGVAAPIYDKDGWAGVLMATIGTDFALGQTRFDHANDAGQVAVVVAPGDRDRDRDPATVDGAGEYIVILHDKLKHGEKVVIDLPWQLEIRVVRAVSQWLREIGVTRAVSQQLPCPEREGCERGDADRVTRGASEQLRWVDHEPITDDAHRDPVRGFEDRWLAGFAPVGATGFVVIVQTRYDAAVKPNARLSRRLASRMSAVILVSIVVFGASLWLYVRRRSRTRANAR
jgi:hypothetical protein